MPLQDAILDAAADRMRPVILTTLTTIAGLLPLTLDLADGGEFWIPLGIAIISGLLVASSLTLYVVPVLYALVERTPGDHRPVRLKATTPDRSSSTPPGPRIAARISDELARLPGT
jgi:predicted RND superfamily exporter protein